MDWQHRFVGRAEDLRLLQNAYEEARSGSPRVFAIVSESGFGKTRLAQEFYNWLSITHDDVGGSGYWPDRLLREADNLQVNPDLNECGGPGKRMPFLWWGLRLADPGQRNVTSATGALPAGIHTLRAHLAEYEREIQRDALRRDQLLGGGKTAADIAISAGETALDAVFNYGTFGTLGIAKAIGQAALAHRAASKEIRALDDLDVRPTAAHGRARDTLSETVIGDLSRLCKVPPKDFEPIPLVIMVDDVQWLDTDGGMGSFLDILLDRARTESWPLLVLLTCWRREWLASVAAGTGPGKLARESAGDLVHNLGGVQGLEMIIREACPGLTTDQFNALATKVEGVPRLLDEMLLYLSRRRKAFIGRDLGNPLTDAGLADVLSHDFAAFVAERLEETPEHVRRALAIASTQGVSFSPRLVHRVAEGLKLVDIGMGLDEGENPHGFVIGEPEEAGGEFRLRVYQTAARDDLGNLLDEADIEDGLRSALEGAARYPSSATERELALILDGAALLGIAQEDWAGHAIDAGAELIRRARATFDSRTAGELSDRLLPLFSDELLYEKRAALVGTCIAALEWNGPDRDTRNALSRLVELMHAHAEEQISPETRGELATALGYLGDIVAVLDGSAAARSLREDAEQITRAIAEEQPTPAAKRDLAVALGRLGGIVEALDGPAAARPLREEEERILRALAKEQQTPGARRELAMGLARLGGTIETLDGSAAARPLREEEERIFRALVAEQPTPEARRDLAIALGDLGDIVEALDGPAAARPLREEEERILRALVDEQPTPRARRDLTLALTRLGGIVEALDGSAAARPLREEEEQIARALAEEQPTPAARHGLANALGRLGGIVETLDESAAARPLREEEEQIARALAEKQPTPAHRRSLAIALGHLGDTVEVLDEPRAARTLREEAVGLAHDLAEDQQTVGARRDFAIALGRLAEIVEALDGPRAARTLREQETLIARTLAEEQPTPGARRELAVTLAHLGGIVEALDGPGAARPLREETAELMHTLAEEEPTLRAKRDLAGALVRLGTTIQALDGHAAARPLREKSAALMRTLAKAQPQRNIVNELIFVLKLLLVTVDALADLDAAQQLIAEIEELERYLREL